MKHYSADQPWAELRIGNLVYEYFNPQDVGNPKAAPVITVTLDWLCKRQWYTSIPLDQEWLLQFGFVFTTQYECRLADFRLMQNEDGEWNLWTNTVNIADEEHSESIGRAFKYVHQLQNLYFALTGDELIVKP